MSDKLEEKTVELLDRSADAIESFAAQLKTLAESYGPEVADLALATARVDAAAGLVTGIAMMVVAVALLGPARWLFKKAREQRQHHGVHTGNEVPGYVAGSVLFCISGIIGGIACLQYLFDAWRWVGLFSPELWLAKTILGL